MDQLPSVLLNQIITYLSYPESAHFASFFFSDKYDFKTIVPLLCDINQHLNQSSPSQYTYFPLIARNVPPIQTTPNYTYFQFPFSTKGYDLAVQFNTCQVHIDSSFSKNKLFWSIFSTCHFAFYKNAIIAHLYHLTDHRKFDKVYFWLPPSYYRRINSGYKRRQPQIDMLCLKDSLITKGQKHIRQNLIEKILKTLIFQLHSLRTYNEPEYIPTTYKIHR